MTEGSGTDRADDERAQRAHVLVVGGGVMGGTLVEALLAAGWSPRDVEVAERDVARAEDLRRRLGVLTAASTEHAAARADVVLVAVKPDVVGDVLTAVGPALRGGAPVISVAAGPPLAFYEQRLPAGTPVIRVMPNTPAQVDEGMAAISAGASATPEHLAHVTELLSAVGKVVTVPEKYQDAVTAISGSGPAYLFFVVEAMIDAGMKRARPIVMTTIAMVAGMMPSALGVGAGGEFRSPMALAVIGGLLFSTILSLVFVPAMFMVMDDVGSVIWRLGRKLVVSSPDAEQAAGEAHSRSDKPAAAAE